MNRGHGNERLRPPRHVVSYYDTVSSSGQQRFTVSEVAADRHELMIPQRIMWPSIAHTNGQLNPRCS